MELKHYRKKGIRHFWLADETISATQLDLISKALLEEKISIYYGVMLRPTSDFTYGIMRRMYRSGCRVVIWGAESFNQRILDLMKKGTRAKDIKKILAFAHRVGLNNVVYMIQGFPTQTEAEIIKDIKVLRKILKYLSNFGIQKFCLYENTYIFRNYAKFGLKIIKRNFLLKGDDFRLPSTEFLYRSKIQPNWKRINMKLSKNHKNGALPGVFDDAGLFYNKEHMLLHAAEKSCKH